MPVLSGPESLVLPYWLRPHPTTPEPPAARRGSPGADPSRGGRPAPGPASGEAGRRGCRRPPWRRTGRDPRRPAARSPTGRPADRWRCPIDAPVGNGTRPSAENGVSRNAASIRAATPAASSAEVSGRISANSSPPYRAGTSEPRSDERMQLRDVDQDAVAIQVAEAVVDELEVVEVEHDDAERAMRPDGADHLLGQALVQVAVVEEARQRVAVGEVAGRLVQAGVLERHRGLVGHRRASVIRPASAVGGPTDTSSMSPIAWPLAINGQHDQPAQPVVAQQVGLGAVGGLVLGVHDLDDAPLEHLAGQREALERVEVVHLGPRLGREAAERAQPVRSRGPSR